MRSDRPNMPRGALRRRTVARQVSASASVVRLCVQQRKPVAVGASLTVQLLGSAGVSVGRPCWRPVAGTAC